MNASVEHNDGAQRATTNGAKGATIDYRREAAVGEQPARASHSGTLLAASDLPVAFALRSVTLACVVIRDWRLHERYVPLIPVP